ncbi:hypothetical protein VDGL01_04583 [Verticillium dahliae]
MLPISALPSSWTARTTPSFSIRPPTLGPIHLGHRAERGSQCAQSDERASPHVENRPAASEVCSTAAPSSTAGGSSLQGTDVSEKQYPQRKASGRSIRPPNHTPQQPSQCATLHSTQHTAHELLTGAVLTSSPTD